ncbi:Sec63 Brl domain-containing protein [Emericellopsis atlantica]|uniref:Sec63 Brl domain-containing protein n=1 Tax=Emericellopsis atlantica TaxID=2614577 RepID=A0A9P7ZRP9_9HYPO|nr:Sec63 Brl domain-containing protein [Emericellopsis atlantica]KAG9257108.1 Sec63 Brl domain-containing protein [Emericellopsis atlantica]
MSSDYSYDEQGQFFPFFVLTVTGLVTLPLTYTLLRKSTDDERLAPRIKTDYKPQDGDAAQKLRSAHKRRQRKVTRALVTLLGWAIMGAMVYLIMTTARTASKIWNPYDILGIADSATEKQIKSHYKRLSLKFHPDKVRPDAAKNETVETLNDYYVELTKAYQALTDEEVRNNYIQYGHPDGKQSYSIGVALPTWIISDGNGKYVVLVYAMLLGVLLPYLVGTWWYGTLRKSKEGVLMESANRLFREYREEAQLSDVIYSLSSGREFETVFAGDQADSGLSRIESRISADSDATKSRFACGFSAKDKQALEDLSEGPRRKALALLWAYLGRIQLDDAALTKAKFEVAPTARALRDAFSAISLAYGNVKPIIASFEANQYIVQALAPGASPLLQLPHMDNKIAAAIEGDSRSHFSVQQFLGLPDAERRRRAVGKGLLSDDQYKTVLNIGSQLPLLHLEKAFFKVTGERCVLPSSLVSLVLKGRVVPPGTQNVPEVNELDLEDVDPAEDDLDAITGRKKTVKGPDGKPITVEENKVLPPLTFAPYYPRDTPPKWHAFLSDSKQGKMAVPPFTFTHFDQPAFDEQGKPTFAVQTLKAQFAAPPQAGQYTFVLHLICDSYVGFDTRVDITMHVEDAAKANKVSDDDEISEPDEDSLAGQMQALKGGQAAPKPRKKKAVDDSEEEDSDSEEEDDDTSATNTDTEDES